MKTVAGKLTLEELSFFFRLSLEFELLLIATISHNYNAMQCGSYIRIPHFLLLFWISTKITEITQRVKITMLFVYRSRKRAHRTHMYTYSKSVTDALLLNLSHSRM